MNHFIVLVKLMYLLVAVFLTDWTRCYIKSRLSNKSKERMIDLTCNWLSLTKRLLSLIAHADPARVTEAKAVLRKRILTVGNGRWKSYIGVQVRKVL